MTNTRKLLIGLLACATMLIGAQQAVARELDEGKRGRPPGNLPCVDNDSGAIACYQEKGDKIWVKDSVKDGHSAYAYWKYPVDGREGLCKNDDGSGKWVYCVPKEDVHPYRTGFPVENRPLYLWAVEHGWTEWSDAREVDS